MNTILSLGCLAILAAAATSAYAAPPLEGFRQGPYWGEQTLQEHTPDGVRVFYNADAGYDPTRPTLVIFFATPNGNTIEQTLGCEMRDGLDWHYNIQHIAAQTRMLRRVEKGRNIALVTVQADQRSWPAWRARNPDNAARIRALVAAAAAKFPSPRRTVALAGHSGGGSFLIGFLNGGDAIPDWVERIAFLDANYSYADEDLHGDKLLAWLKADPTRQLVVLAYDDRSITLDGKPVVGPTGGTFRATIRMRNRFAQDTPLQTSRAGDIETTTGLDGRIRLLVDQNPNNKILHTVLVETNGFLETMTAGTPYHRGFTYRGDRAYGKWIQPAERDAPIGTLALSTIPPAPANAEGGTAFMARIEAMPPAEREQAIGDAILRGNIPSFLRVFKTLETSCVDDRGRRHTATFSVAPDYLAVGTDTDWVRAPMTPMTAARIAAGFGCSLPTRRIVDIVDNCAEVRLEPKPLTQDREAVATFVQHNAIIEGQRAGKPLGALVCGIKKDVVLTGRLKENPRRVAIYGWRLPDGMPIQPLTTVHKDTYVDYSHGIRLIDRRITVDGIPRDMLDVLAAKHLWPLLSDEGSLSGVRIPVQLNGK
ncbi:MAG TPA: hypothetical protein VGM37_05250 [Armatimonadota bacterium]|jgi:hypothetical protein